MARGAKENPKLIKTEFRLSAAHAGSVFITGDFNQWNLSAQPLQQDKKGVWRISFVLGPGRYEYRFLVDGEWQNDPNCSSYVENRFGTLNCLRVVE
jgi:1,4-alpha-glucan branching enzyme